MLRLPLIAIALCACKDKAPAEPPPPPVTIAPPTPTTSECTSAPVCLFAAHELEEANDAKGASRVLRRGCELYRLGEACYQRALMLHGDRGIDEDPPDAQRHYLKACELGFHDGCADAGVNYLKGYGGAQDLTKVDELLVKACTAKSGLGCYNLAVVVRDGRTGGTADRAKAVTLFEKACGLGNAAGCNDFGLALLRGGGIEKDTKRAAVIFDKACRMAAKHCRNLGFVYEAGEGVTPDVARARQLYDKACGAGNFGACNALGSMKMRGDGGAKDVAGARALFKQTCDAGDADGCASLRDSD